MRTKNMNTFILLSIFAMYTPSLLAFVSFSAKFSHAKLTDYIIGPEHLGIFFKLNGINLLKTPSFFSRLF